MLKPIADLIRVIAQPISEKPAEIFEQVQPLMMKMGLANLSDRSKVQIIPGKSQGGNSLYSIMLRRNARIVPDTIDRIKRNSDYLNVIQWNAKAIEVQVWYPYKPPEGAVPEVPAGAPPAPPH